ncbi:Signal transduction histidine kinase [Nonomuraea wenchangensis]|uniref:histidine kinase n=2 Tax=Nonomuraea wenchangensis TaxID=568860 RepID=A0A1I0I1R3_9ACTN|nr:Signal transduction histidine kinase [Nonomuraea wenchangensis]
MPPRLGTDGGGIVGGHAEPRTSLLVRGYLPGAMPYGQRAAMVRAMTEDGAGALAQLLRARPRLVDSAVAAVLVALGAGQVMAGDGAATALIISVAMTAPVALRRRWPLPAVLIGWSALFVGEGLGADVTSQGYAPVIALILTVYSVAVHAPLRRALVGLVAALALVWGAIPFAASQTVADFAFTGLITLAPWLAGRTIRDRQLRITELRRLARELEHEREERAREARDAERSRIAREMHDVLAHAVSVVVVQLGAVERIMESDPDKARSMVASVRATAKSALAELRFLLGLDGVPAAGPRPSLARLGDLADDMRAAGVPVELTVRGSVGGLPPAVDLAAYRIVQESLTNVMRHATGAPTRALVVVDEDAVRVTVENDGAVRPASRVNPPERAGYGLIGMAERARLCGGDLEAEPRPGGGFRVQARLPLVRAVSVA